MWRFRHLLGAVGVIALMAASPAAFARLQAPPEYAGGNRADPGALTRAPSIAGILAKIYRSGLIAADALRLAQALAQPQSRLSTTDQERLKRLAQALVVSSDEAAGFLRILSQVQDPKPVDPINNLAWIAAGHEMLIQQLSLIGDTNPDMVRLRQEVQQLLKRGDYDGAGERLTKARQATAKRKKATTAQRMDAAAIIAALGHLAQMQLRYPEAAAYFEEASEAAPAQPMGYRTFYLDAQAQALLRKALFRGTVEEREKVALGRAAILFRKVLNRTPRESMRFDWAMTQYFIGTALTHLGKGDSDTARLNEAAAAFLEALTGLEREREPLEWASTQMSFGYLLAALGEREGTTARLGEAAAAYREALKEFTRDRAPLDWAIAQNSLGLVLVKMAQFDSGTTRLEEAAQAFREALKEYTFEHTPLQWGPTQTNLGGALATLGEREDGTVRLEESVAVSREALKAQTREGALLGWALTQNNLAAALVILGEREKSAARLKEAVAAGREALQVRTLERAPQDYAMTQYNLGIGLRLLGILENNTAQLKDAVTAHNEVLKGWPRNRRPRDWAANQFHLATALFALGLRESGTERLESARDAYKAALSFFKPAGMAPAVQVVETDLAQVEAELSKRVHRSTPQEPSSWSRFAPPELPKGPSDWYRFTPNEPQTRSQQLPPGPLR